MRFLQVYFLHFAGGNVYSFNPIINLLKSEAKCKSIELPGRGKRMQEFLIKDFDSAVKDYLDQIVKNLRDGEEFIIYGHSMGATLGLHVAKKLEDLGVSPKYLIVSGNPGPGVGREEEKRYLMSDSKFKEALKELGGVSNEVLENEELFGFFNPILRADFEILEKEEITGVVVNCPIFSLMGSDEKYVNEIENWRNFTRSNFEFEILEGNHFFIYDHAIRIAEIIERVCG